jgi:hypothetical protein
MALERAWQLKAGVLFLKEGAQKDALNSPLNSLFSFFNNREPVWLSLAFLKNLGY